MPGTNAGTGQPLVLRCAKCKTRSDLYRRGFDLVATGLVRPAQKRGVRQAMQFTQYRCLECGHVGWTQHIDGLNLRVVAAKG